MSLEFVNDDNLCVSDTRSRTLHRKIGHVFNVHACGRFDFDS